MEPAGAIFVRLAMSVRRKLQGASVPIGLPLSAVLILYAYRRLRAPKTRLVNWCGDHEAHPASLHFPETEGEIRAIVLEAQRRNERVKVGGGLHSWSSIAMPATGVQTRFIVLDRFNHVLHLDETARTVTIEAGIHLWELHQWLHPRGWALPVLGSVSSQSIAGALATGTHGSGVTKNILANGCVALDLLTADGSMISASLQQNHGVFKAALVSLGALGIVLRLTLRVVPAFLLRSQAVKLQYPDFSAQLPSLLKRWANFKVTNGKGVALTLSHPYTGKEVLPGVSSFDYWMSEYFLVKYLADPIVLNATQWAPSLIAPFLRLYTKILPPAGPLIADRSNLVFNYLHIPQHDEAEWCVDVTHTTEVLSGVLDLIEKNNLPMNMPMEVRWIAADDIPLSTAYKRDTLSITFMLRQPPAVCVAVFRTLEVFFSRYQGRAHWGKKHTLQQADVALLYPALPAFQAVRAQTDPTGVFANDYTDRVLGPAPSAKPLPRM